MQDEGELWTNLSLLGGFLQPLLRVETTMGTSEMTERTRASWLVYVLGALCAGAIVAAVLLVGPASSSTATITRTATVAQGVVQSTVSGSGNLQAASQLNLGFKTSGTVTHIYVTQGQHVTQGQLIATLDPQSAEVTLEQAKASLQSAEANLAKEEETDGEGSTAAGTSGSGAGNASAASAASFTRTSTADATTAAYAPTETVPSGTGSAPTTVPAATTPTSTTPAATTPTSTTPTSTTPVATTPAASTPTTTPSKRTGSTTTNATGKGTATSREGEGKESDSGGSSSKATLSTATREANLASAKAAVRSDTLTVQSDEQAVQDTKLYAPESGTIVSLSGQEGEVVSGSGTTRAASTAGTSGGSTASATGAAAAGGRSATGSSAASSSGDSSSSSFAVLSDLSSMQLVVALSESEIGSVKAGQIATVTVEALNGSKLAAHVSEVGLLSTSTSGAVSYDVTFQLDQLAAGLKIGMSATAEVVVKQAEGINVPTSAITADTVTVERDGKRARQRVVTGLAGNTSTIILSGLKAGETVVLPAASTSSSSATNVLSKIGSRLGGAGIGGAGLGGAGGGGGGAFFRGGG
jgi:HlyD family secretion protein